MRPATCGQQGSHHTDRHAGFRPEPTLDGGRPDLDAVGAEVIGRLNEPTFIRITRGGVVTHAGYHNSYLRAHRADDSRVVREAVRRAQIEMLDEIAWAIKTHSTEKPERFRLG